MDRSRTHQLFKFDHNVILITVALLTGQCVMGRYAERLKSHRKVDSLLPTFFVNEHFLLAADLGYLALRSFLA